MNKPQACSSRVNIGYLPGIHKYPVRIFTPTVPVESVFQFIQNAWAQSPSKFGAVFRHLLLLLHHLRRDFVIYFWTVKKHSKTSERS
jgi:hypothetical protein